MFYKLRTPDTPLDPVTYRQILLTVPANADIERFIWGAVSAISFHTAWIPEGTMSPEEVAFYLKTILRSRTEFDMLGAIVPLVREVIPSSMLLADGAMYNKVDYPELWEVWPSAMKDVSTLTLPDLTSKFLLGASVDYSAYSEGGEAEVTLTEAQMPSHVHGYDTPITNVDIESVGIPDPTGVGFPYIPAFTDSAGGDEAHNNMPPYYAVVYAVIAKVLP